MELQEFNFEYKVEVPVELPVPWIHFGVVGSGDMEVLMERKDLQGGKSWSRCAPRL